MATNLPPEPGRGSGGLPDSSPLCAHCSLPLPGRRCWEGPRYCCTGCALVHRLSGDAGSQGQAIGLLMVLGLGSFLAMNVVMLSLVLPSGAISGVPSGWLLLALATPAFALLSGPFLQRGLHQLREGRLDTDLLILLGVAAAYGISARSLARGGGPLYLDTAMGILLFLTLSRYLEASARVRSIAPREPVAGYPLAAVVDRASLLFPPTVLVIAVATFAFWAWRAGAGAGLMSSLSVLLIACPCAIDIATPLVSRVAADRARTRGALVRSGAVFERLARSRQVFFGKTGILTTGDIRVLSVEAATGLSPETVLAVAAALEQGSEHPIGRAIRTAWRGELPELRSPRQVPGRGVRGTVVLAGVPRQARLGSAEFLGATPTAEEPGLLRVHLALDRVWQGAVVLCDALRPEAREAVAELRSRGLRMEVLSGGSPPALAAFARSFSGLTAEGGLTPQEQLDWVRAAAGTDQHPILVGDGHGTPTLGGDAITVALGAGAEPPSGAEDVTLLDGDLRRLPWLIDLSRQVLRTSRANLLWSFAYNTVGIAIAVAGWLHPLLGGLGMVGSSLLVVLRSRRVEIARLS